MKFGFRLRKKAIVCFVAVCSLFAFALLNAAEKTKKVPVSLVGYWQTIDHDTRKPSSVIKIWRAKNGRYFGKIHYIYREHGHKKSDVCHKCKGELHNKPVLGMEIIKNFQATKDPNFYNKGRIMDPTNGKTYRCHMTLKNNGQVLDVHGYIGIPLFGRSDIWYRVHPINR